MPSILIIEDEAFMLDSVATVLRLEGHRVKTVVNGQAGLDAAKMACPDLILCDVDLPSMNGFEILRELKTDVRTRAIPVILMSAYANPELHQKSSQLGASYYLLKPFDIEELLETVWTAIEQRGCQAAR